MNRFLLLCGASALAASLATSGLAEEGHSRFIENDTIESVIGDFEFVKGFPTPETTEKLFDVRTTYRVMEVIQQNAFAASLYAMRKGFADASAGKPNQVLVWFDRMDAKSELLTANTDTVYAITFLDLKTDGPTVVEAPARMIGFMDDMWMRYVTDIGAAGPDKGEGGKFLILPPGYDGDVPEGYFVATSKTYGVWLALRARLDADGGNSEAKELYSKLKIYPLAQADNPEPTELINASGVEICTPKTSGCWRNLENSSKRNTRMRWTARRSSCSPRLALSSANRSLRMTRQSLSWKRPPGSALRCCAQTCGSTLATRSTSLRTVSGGIPLLAGSILSIPTGTSTTMRKPSLLPMRPA